MNNYPCHIVTVSACVTNGSGDVLMVRSPRRGWEFPGGQVEEGETLLAALRREIEEESGIVAEIGMLVGIYSNVRTPSQVNFGFLAQAVSGTLQISEESLESNWIARADVLSKITHPSIFARMRDMLNFLGRIRYRVYTSEPYQVYEERWLNTITEERL